MQASYERQGVSPDDQVETGKAGFLPISTDCVREACSKVVNNHGYIQGRLMIAQARTGQFTIAYARLVHDSPDIVQAPLVH